MQGIVAMAWTDRQVREFGKRFASSSKAPWPAFVDEVREALIDSFILLLVLGQDCDDVKLEEIRSVRTRLAVCIATKHQMTNPTAEQHPHVSPSLDRR
jgi:hypothetical protein